MIKKTKGKSKRLSLKKQAVKSGGKRRKPGKKGTRFKGKRLRTARK